MLYRLFLSGLAFTHIVQPATILRWHRQDFRTYWRWKSRDRAGRPKIDVELRDLIRRISIENPLWGAPRIYGELLLLGYSVSQTSVAKYTVKRPTNGGSQTWKTFLENHKDGIASMDFIIIPTIRFKLLYCPVILSHARRMIIQFAVGPYPQKREACGSSPRRFPGMMRQFIPFAIMARFSTALFREDCAAWRGNIQNSNQFMPFQGHSVLKVVASASIRTY